MRGWFNDRIEAIRANQVRAAKAEAKVAKARRRSIEAYKSYDFSASPRSSPRTPEVEMTKQVAWVNFYHDFVGNRGSAHTTKEAADIWRKGRIACVRVEFEEGEGLQDDEQKRST